MLPPDLNQGHPPSGAQHCGEIKDTQEDQMGQMTVAQAIARALERLGTEVIFGVNGHGNWALLDAVVNETKIRGVPARVEDQAVQMADGSWRMPRSPPLPVAPPRA